MPRKVQCIYDYLNEFEREEIDKVLESLSENDKKTIYLRYGSDLNNPVINKDFDKKAYAYFYGSLIPKIKRTLNNIRKNKKLDKEVLNENKTSSVNETVVLETISTDDKVLSKNDYFYALSLLQSPQFKEILSIFTLEEAIVVCLKLGYIDGKHFETKAVSEFLGIEEKRIYEIVHKFLEVYKENVLEFIDKIIEGANKENFSLTKKLDN